MRRLTRVRGGCGISPARTTNGANQSCKKTIKKLKTTIKNAVKNFFFLNNLHANTYIIGK